jgi:hypothetical protein
LGTECTHDFVVQFEGDRLDLGAYRIKILKYLKELGLEGMVCIIWHNIMIGEGLL